MFSVPSAEYWTRLRTAVFTVLLSQRCRSFDPKMSSVPLTEQCRSLWTNSVFSPYVTAQQKAETSGSLQYLHHSTAGIWDTMVYSVPSSEGYRRLRLIVAFESYIKLLQEKYTHEFLQYLGRTMQKTGTQSCLHSPQECCRILRHNLSLIPSSECCRRLRHIPQPEFFRQLRTNSVFTPSIRTLKGAEKPMISSVLQS